MNDKLRALRAQMKRAGIAAYFVPSTDPHQSEYVPACWQRRQWLSGFSGSAGDLLVTDRAAYLWTDGRYFIQAEAQLADSGIGLQKQGVEGTLTVSQWLAAHLRRGQALGVDPKLMTRSQGQRVREDLDPAGIKLKLIERNLVDAIWSDRPSLPPAPAEAYPTRFAGETVTAKLRRLRKAIKATGARAHVLTALDCIAWLFNIRGSDVPHNPVTICYALITADRATLFIDPRKVTPALRRALGKSVTIQGYDRFGDALTRLATKKRGRVWVDAVSVNLWLCAKLANCELLNAPSPIWHMKSAKNATELDGMRRAHLRDGVAMVKFLHDLDQAMRSGERWSEQTVVERLTARRAEGEHYRGDSFETIAGYAAHGAIVHYAVTEASNRRLRPKGILLIDSGGQYLDGTTDITRTVLLGNKASREQRDRFTRVLKGHIALSRVRFPAGTAGRQIDALARLALWEAGLDYAHGTGHGVGCYLNVHEGPQAISPTRCTGVPLAEGNVMSNEPGYYCEGAYGIRIENLINVIKDDALSPEQGRAFLRFETLTLCPIDTRLVRRSLLNKKERAWLNAYHTHVRRQLTPLLPAAAARWLRDATKPI